LAATDAQDALGVDLAFDLNNPRVLDTLASLAKKVKGVADTTKDEIRALVGQATQEGWSPADLASAIRAHGVTASASRAHLIAVTETASAYSAGSVLAYQDSGVVSGKQWIITDDACEICAPLADKIVALDESFADGIDYPGAHPACRCAIAPVLRDSSHA
jgi:SPP1 gp7 family putative phage head morphogenesis protein